jgi:hypothetical protein
MKGARVAGHLYGAPFNGGVRRYKHDSGDATAIFRGDFVKLAGSADTEGLPTVVQAAATDTLLGVVVGFEADLSNLSLLHCTASTNRVLLVADDPNTIFSIQEDSVGGALTAAEVGENADITVGTGSTVTGLSGMELDSSDHKTATAQLRILRLDPTPGNEVGTNAKYLVVINEHVLKSTTGV